MKIPNLIPMQSVGAAKPCDISVIIAHRGPEMGLWFTMESCMMGLEKTGLTYEFRICANGEETISDDMRRIQHWTEQEGHIGEFFHSVQPLAPPTARQMVTEHANGKYLFFFDNHCLPTPGYFLRGVQSMEKYNIDFLHSTTKFFSGEGTDYEYKLSLKRDFWTLEPYKKPLDPENPYRIACAGHGGFVVRNSAWKECRGYWEGFEGYGGEETYTDLKFWLFGKQVWLDPLMIHKHWAGKREYTRHFTDDFFRNMYMAANCIGGEAWLARVFSSTMKCSRFVNKRELIKIKPLYDLMVEAQKKSQSHSEWIASRRTKTLDELLVWFDENGIRR
jgi:hypothetical protein